MNKIDMTGWKMWEHGVPESHWEIIEEDKTNKQKGVYWFCKCNLCGEIESKNGTALRKGKTKQCKNCSRQPSFINMTGWIMKEHGVPDSRVTVLEELPEKTNDKRSKWKCQCDCGTIFSANGQLLRNGITKSCGCYNRDSIRARAAVAAQEKIGKRNGMLTVKEFLGFRPKKNSSNYTSYFLCQCDCGNYIELDEKRVQDGRVKSCGCISTSIGEKLIENLLNKNHIIFQHDVCYKPLIHDTNRNLRFDFIIYNGDNTINRFVEFDGIQHETGIVGGTWGKIDNKEIIQERDTIKNNWCLKNNYLLVRIPYTKLNTLCLDDIMGNKFIYKEGGN